MVCKASKVLPGDLLPKECNVDLLKFLPGRKQWLAFVKCLVEDDVTKLASFSKRVAWTDFLQSQDVRGVWRHCEPKMFSSDRQSNLVHSFPTNPFLVAMFYNAQKCLMLMKQSGLDFSRLTEQGFNAYHTLMSALQFMLKSHRMNGGQPDVWSLVVLFHHQLFTRAEQAFMYDKLCQYGMSPISWGVYIGLAKYVEYIIYYYSPDWALETEAVGIREHIKLDLTHFSGEYPEFFICPINVLMDIYSQGSLDEVKELGIFRKGFIWRRWVEELYNRAWMSSVVMLSLIVLLSIGTSIFFGVGSEKFLKERCNGIVSTHPADLLVTLISWIMISVFSLVMCAIGILRKEIFRRKFGYPKWPRRSYPDQMSWLAPLIVILPVSLFLFWLHLYTNISCKVFGDKIYATSGCCTILLILASLVLISCYMQMIWPLTTVMTSFYNSVGTFTLFALAYSLLTAVFTRMFQASSVFMAAQRATSNASGSMNDSMTEFFRSYYTTFLVSLNVIDTSVFSAKEDRIDLSLTHIAYILAVPVLFINFVVGILSNVVNQVVENDVEHRYWLMLTIAEFFERTFYPMYRLRSMMFGSKKLELSICTPLCPESKLVTFSDFSLDSVQQADTKSDLVELTECDI